MSDTNEPKSKWLESEWYLTIGTIILGLLIKLGFIESSQQALATDILNDIVALIMIVGPVLGWQFVRTKKKIAETKQQADNRANDSCAILDPPKFPT